MKETESVLLLLKESSSVYRNLALQKFLQAINFRFTRTNTRLQPVTATRIFPPRAI